MIDLFCCFFNDCGFSHCCYQTCCADKSKGGYAPTGSKDVEKAELKEVGNDHEEETKTVPDEKEDAAAKEKYVFLWYMTGFQTLFRKDLPMQTNKQRPHITTCILSRASTGFRKLWKALKIVDSCVAEALGAPYFSLQMIQKVTLIKASECPLHDLKSLRALRSCHNSILRHLRHCSLVTPKRFENLLFRIRLHYTGVK